MDMPFFTSLIPGFFVRIGIGMDPQSRMNVYRVAQVSSVVSKGSYLLSGKQTTKWLQLLIGDKAKEFRMETISNRPFSEVGTASFIFVSLPSSPAPSPLPHLSSLILTCRTNTNTGDCKWSEQSRRCQRQRKCQRNLRH